MYVAISLTTAVRQTTNEIMLNLYVILSCMLVPAKPIILIIIMYLLAAL